MKKSLTLALLCLTLSAPSITQAKESQKPIDKMFGVMSMEKQMAGGFEAMLPMIDQMASRFNLDGNARQELKGIFRTWFNEDIDRAKITNKMKQLYSQHFTDDEIEKITAFYQTPVGKKFLEKSPQLMQLGAQIGMQEAQLKQTKLNERIKPFLAKHGIKR